MFLLGYSCILYTILIVLINNLYYLILQLKMTLVWHCMHAILTLALPLPRH